MPDSIEKNRKYSLLIVDDNEFNLDIINEYVEGEGFLTVPVENAIDALNYLESNLGLVDVILLDRMMPHMNGLEMVAKLRTDNRFMGIPVIMISAAADQKAINEGKKAGVFDYITKPFERDQLLGVITRAITHVGEKDTV